MAANSSAEVVFLDAIQSPSQLTVAPSADYTVAANVNRVKVSGGTPTITLAVTSNSPVWIDCNGQVVGVTDGTRTWGLGDSGQTSGCLCVRAGGSGNDWIVIGADETT